MKPLCYLFRDVLQLAYVTDDIDAATAYFESSLGTVQCETHYASALKGVVTVDGELAEEWVIDVALVNAGPTNLEIIKPVSGAVDLYRPAIRSGLPATFHHVGFRISDFDEATAILTASGKSWKQYGETSGIRFGYFDMTAELGHFVEVMELDPAASSRFDALERASNVQRR
jgi:hypothetical protein